MNTNLITDTGSVFQVREKLAALEEALVAKSPNMPTLLRDIHRKLKDDPDTVTVLSEEEIAVLIRGLKQQTATEIATAAIKKHPIKALSRTTTDDL